jgi:ubiquitin C-terminal hydrolase
MGATATFHVQNPHLGNISSEDTERIKDLINQCDDKEFLEKMIKERRQVKKDLEQNKSKSHNKGKGEINDLSDMVQKLLSE